MVTTNKQVAFGIVVILIVNGVGFSQGTGPVDAVERSIYFIDKSYDATDLFNSNKPQEALEIFRELVENYSDLDQDGFVAMSMGDCLAALGQYQQARMAYVAAGELHVELAKSVSRRLVELALADNVTDALIDQLRTAAGAEEADRIASSWQLGRALQKRVKTLLTEASAAFGAGIGPDAFSYSRSSVSRYCTTLDELAEDLATVIEYLENKWAIMGGGFGRTAQKGDKARQPEIVITSQNWQWVVSIDDEKEIEFQIKCDPQDAKRRITADNEPVKLTKTQKLLIDRYQERINTILLRAIGEMETTDN